MVADCDRFMHEQKTLTQSTTPGSVISRSNFSQKPTMLTLYFDIVTSKFV